VWRVFRAGVNKAIRACHGVFYQCLGAPMEINWSRVGSAQQYQGSLRNGTPAWGPRTG